MELPHFIAPEEWTRQPIFESHFRWDRVPKIPGKPHICQYAEDIYLPKVTILPIRRIGSESSDAEVYQVEYQGFPAALKVMPLLNDDSETKDLTEIKRAFDASGLVNDRISDHFLVVYAAGICPNVTFFLHSKFTREANDYACLESLRKAYPHRLRHINALYKQIPSAVYPRSYEVAARLGLDNSVCDFGKARAHLLLSELAQEDLRNWATRAHPVEIWYEVIRQIFEGIRDLHAELSICHNDLHPGNVLIAVGQPLRVIIHDFGRSVQLTDDNWKEDYQEILNKIRYEDLLISRDIRDTCLTILQFISRYEDPVDESDFYEEITELLV